MQLKLECDLIDFSVVWFCYPVNIEITESLSVTEPIVDRRLQTQTSTSKEESDFRLGWDVERVVKGAAGLTYGRYSVVLLTTRSTTEFTGYPAMAPNLSEVARLTTLPKTANAKKHHFVCGMHRSTRHACYYKVTHTFCCSTDDWGRGH